MIVKRSKRTEAYTFLGRNRRILEKIPEIAKKLPDGFKVLHIGPGLPIQGMPPETAELLYHLRKTGKEHEIHVIDINKEVLRSLKEKEVIHWKERNKKEEDEISKYAKRLFGEDLKDSKDYLQVKIPRRLRKRIKKKFHDIVSKPMDREYDLIIFNNPTTPLETTNLKLKPEERMRKLAENLYKSLKAGGTLIFRAIGGEKELIEQGFKRVSSEVYKKY